MGYRSSRRGLFFIVFVCLVVAILLHRSRFLIGLLFEDGARYSIPTDTTLPQEYTSNETGFLIPKIIHQTYKDENIPEHWREAQKATKLLHPDYEYMFWTDASSLSFIQTHYPTFLPIYTSYPYPIQRADAIRYFILFHYGGIYLDLDINPYRNFSSLLQYPAFACRTSPTGISNDILGARKGHPFFGMVVENLKAYSKNWIVPYITVMYTTGPLFLSAIWIQYLRSSGTSGLPENELKLLFPNKKQGDSYGYFSNVQGGSWHGGDFEAILWMGRHWVLVTVAGFVLGFGVTGLAWVLAKRCCGPRGRDKNFRRDGYERVGDLE
ncbi:MIPC synthase subunit [Tricladium varicosporioides]|nr:MIPC synthase subunit [Hymenoscyphus varicosporioides]